jgi:hypothetical protein
MTVTYSYETSLMTKVDGMKTRLTKSVVDGDKGLSIYYLKKQNDNIKRVRAVETNGKFNVIVNLGEDEKKHELNEKEFVEMVKSDKDLDYVAEYMKNRTKVMKEVAEVKTEAVSETVSSESKGESKKANAPKKTSKRATAKKVSSKPAPSQK